MMSIFSSKKFLFFFSLFLLTLNFNNHYFSTLPMQRFLVNDFPSESHVYSRMLYNETHERSDRGGFMVHYKFFDDFDPASGQKAYEGLREKAAKTPESEVFDYEYHLRIQDDIMTPVWLALRAFRDTVLEKSRDGSRWQKRMQTQDTYYFILISQAIIALFNATVFALFLQWVARQISTPTAYITLSLMLVGIPALGFFGHSMWWMMGFWFLPFLVMAYAYQFNKGQPLALPALIGTSILAGIGLGLSAAMGYEYTSTIMVSAVIPTTFYAFYQQWKGKSWFAQCFVIGLFQLAAMALTIYLHYQALKDYGLDATEIILKRFQVRAYGGDVIGSLDGLVGNSVNANIFKVIAMNFFLPQVAGLPQFIMTLPLFIWLWQRRKVIKQQTALIKALLVSITLGAFGAISMFVILKGHSYIHGYDIIAWSIPMNLLLAVFYAQWIKQSFMNAQRK